MSDSFDVAIAGGGPAGAITGLCLARLGWRVGIFESTAFDGDRFGETLPPEVTPVLRELGVWDAFLGQFPLESPGHVSTWGYGEPVEVDFAQNAYGCGWHIDRNRFDSMLCQQAVAAGASLFLKRRVAWMRYRGRWEFPGFHARFLVNAAGVHGPLLDRSKSREREDALLSIVFRVECGADNSYDQRTWIETAPDGWWYSTLLPQGGGLAMFFTGAEIYRQQGISIQRQLQAAPHVRAQMKKGRVSQPRIVYAPSGCSKVIYGSDWVSVGDSASSYDPLSGRGIFKALRQSEVAARAIDCALRGSTDALDGYASQVRREFELYGQQRRRFYSSERRWSEHPFWRARYRKSPF